MSVENRIFWLLVGVLALFLVFSAGGRNAVNTFINMVFGFGTPGGAVGPSPHVPPNQQKDDPHDTQGPPTVNDPPPASTA